MSHADALGAYDDTVDPMPPDLPDRIIRAQREDFDDRAPARPLSLLRELLGDAPQRQSDFALWPPTRPYGEAGLTVRQGDETPRIPTPQLDAARRRDVNDRTLSALIDGAGGEAIRALHARIAEEAARTRSLLPNPPEGWEWEAELRHEAIGREVLGEVLVKIVYRLREVTP